MAGERKLIDIIGSGFALFSHDESLEAMAGDPDHCAVIAAATADGMAAIREICEGMGELMHRDLGGG